MSNPHSDKSLHARGTFPWNISSHEQQNFVENGIGCCVRRITMVHIVLYDKYFDELFSSIFFFCWFIYLLLMLLTTFVLNSTAIILNDYDA